MSDIKIPSHHSGLGQTKPGFITKNLEEVSVPEPKKTEEPATQVKVPFDKFVQLVATHDFESVMSKYANENIILSTSLLTDLANAYPEDNTHKSRMPIFFIAGIILGIIITYLIVRL